MRIVLLLAFAVMISVGVSAQNFSVIAYYAGDSAKIHAYPVEKLTHIIFSFCHLKGNRLNVDNKRDTATIKTLVSLKKRNPKLKVILSLGGWTGCKTCSEVFSTAAGRSEFAVSVKNLNDYFKTDGIDLDWEYPAIEGPPGHAFSPNDKQNFTELIRSLRRELGPKHELSFAAGGFTSFFNESIEWSKVSPLVDKINIMTYDLVHGASKVSGHHTPLYSTKEKLESTDHAVRYLDSLGVPKNKLVIGAAFYSRIFANTTDANQGLYQPTAFLKSFSHQDFDLDALKKDGFTYYWDDVAKAPYLYSSSKKQLISGDNDRSVTLKTKYAIDKKLNGIMFWQLGEDKTSGGLLDAIDRAVKQR